MTKIEFLTEIKKLTNTLTIFSKKHLRISTSQCLFISFENKDLDTLIQGVRLLESLSGK